MSTKNVLLIAAAVAVMAMGVYLFVQVRASTSAEARPTVTPPAPTSSTEPTRTATPVPSSPTPLPPVQSRPAPSPGDPGSHQPVREVQAPVIPTDEQRANPKLENMMELANKAYDRQDYDEASAIAGKLLSKDPTNVRMLRIMVSANCIQGDTAIAQQHYEKLPKFDREQMKARCDRYGVTFKDPAQ